MRPSPSFLSRLIHGVLAGVVVLCFGRWVIRYLDICLLGPYSLTGSTGGEAPFVYNVWKIVNGDPLYDNPFSGLATGLPLYNFLSYYIYAFFLEVLHVADARVVSIGTGITGLLCLGGSYISGLTACRVLDLQRTAHRSLAFLCAIFCWFAPLPFGPYNYQVRADMPACFFVSLALLFVVTGLRKSHGQSLLLAGVCFYLAWACKQSAISALIGAVFYLSLRTFRWRFASCIVVPFVALVALTFFFSTPDYRLCTMVAPTVNHFQWPRGFLLLFYTLSVVPLLLLSPFAYGLLRTSWLTKWNPPSFFPGSRADALRLLFHVVVVNFILSIPAMARAGGTPNFLVEAGLASVPFLVWILLLLPKLMMRTSVPAKRGGLLAVVLVSFLATAIYPLGSIARQIHDGYGLWDDRQRIARVRDAEAWLMSQPQPVLILHEGLSLPWISSGGKYPALQYDLCMHYIFQQQGDYVKGGPSWAVEQRIPALVLIEKDQIAGVDAPLYDATLAAHYQHTDEDFRFDGIDYEVFRR